MFENKTYRRFKKLYKYITDKDCSYTRTFDYGAYAYKTFHTKLGDRNVIASLLNKKTIMLGYHDYNNDILFSLVINTKGRVEILYSKIDELAIYSAIYELECLISDIKIVKRDRMLQRLFDLYPSTSPNGMFYYSPTYYK